MDTAIQVTSLIGSLSTIILGVIAIWLSLFFFRETSRLHSSLTSMISRVEASSRATEVTSRDVLQPVVETILGVVRDSTRVRVDSLAYSFMQRSAAGLDKVLKAQSASEKEAAREAFIEELNSLLGTLKHEVGKVGVAFEAEADADHDTAGQITVAGADYSWNAFVRRIRDLEANHQFLSVKWLREKKLAGEPQAQAALQAAIDQALLVTYFRDNPKNPPFPTLCCRLNEEHHVVKEALKAIGGVAS